MDNKLFTLTKRDLDIALFASKDSSRPILCHVHVQRKDGSVRLMATDSYVAVIYNVAAIEMPDFESFLIPADTLLTVKKIMGQRTQTVKKIGFRFKQYKIVDVAVVYADRIEIPTLDAVLRFKPIGESDVTKYLDIEKLLLDVRGQEVNQTIALNQAYLSKVSKFVSSDTACNGNCTVTIGGKLQPVKITGGDTIGVVMPLKS